MVVFNKSQKGGAPWENIQIFPISKWQVDASHLFSQWSLSLAHPYQVMEAKWDVVLEELQRAPDWEAILG